MHRSPITRGTIVVLRSGQTVKITDIIIGPKGPIYKFGSGGQFEHKDIAGRPCVKCGATVEMDVRDCMGCGSPT